MVGKKKIVWVDEEVRDELKVLSVMKRISIGELIKELLNGKL